MIGRSGGARAAGAVLLLLACSGGEFRVREVPVYPGSRPRSSESAFQERLQALLMPLAQPPPEVRIHETAASFAAVVDFYEPLVAEGLPVRQFSVASRMRQLAEGARRGSRQQLAVGRLLFAPGAAVPPGRAAAGVAAATAAAGESGSGRAATSQKDAADGAAAVVDSVAAGAIADSLTALADRLAGVRGLVALGSVRLATTPPSVAVISIERPHLNAETLSVDSVTVVTVATPRGSAAAP